MHKSDLFLADQDDDDQDHNDEEADEDYNENNIHANDMNFVNFETDSMDSEANESNESIYPECQMTVGSSALILMMLFVLKHKLTTKLHLT